jgi:hypothetical protein
VNSDPENRNSALARRASDTPAIWDEVRFQKLWLALQRREWRSLAVLSASASIDTLRVAELIAKLAWRYSGKPTCVLDFRDLSLRLVEYHQREMLVQAQSGIRAVIALRPTFENPTAIPIARAAEAAALCIDLGVADFESAEQTISEVGRDRVVGAIVLRRRVAKKGAVGDKVRSANR